MERHRIALRCECGNAVLRPRLTGEPAGAVELLTSLCPECDSGDFEQLAYLDREGREVCADPEAA